MPIAHFFAAMIAIVPTAAVSVANSHMFVVESAVFGRRTVVVPPVVPPLPGVTVTIAAPPWLLDATGVLAPIVGDGACDC